MQRQLNFAFVALLVWCAVFVILLAEKSRYVRWWPFTLVFILVYGGYATVSYLRASRRDAERRDWVEPPVDAGPKSSGKKEGTTRTTRKTK